MTLNKAIEIKEERQLFHPRVHDPDRWDADQLGIEALKRVLNSRVEPKYSSVDPLPGETEE